MKSADLTHFNNIFKCCMLQNVANEETFFLCYIYKMLFYKFYLTQKNVIDQKNPKKIYVALEFKRKLKYCSTSLKNQY